MDFAELKNKTEKDLREMLSEKRGRLRDLNFQASAVQLKNVRAIRKVKKEIAQVMTILNAKHKHK